MTIKNITAKEAGIEVSTLFGRTAYSLMDGTQILSYRTKESALRKLAAVTVRENLKHLLSQFDDDYRVDKKQWEGMVKQQYQNLLNSVTF